MACCMAVTRMMLVRSGVNPGQGMIIYGQMPPSIYVWISIRILFGNVYHRQRYSFECPAGGIYQDHAQRLNAGIFNRDLTCVMAAMPTKFSHFDHVGEHAVFCSFQRTHLVNDEHVAADPLMRSLPCGSASRRAADIRFWGCVVNGRGLRQNRPPSGCWPYREARFIQQHVTAFELRC